MVKKCISFLLAALLICTCSFCAFATQGGKITETLSWSYTEGDGLRITGSGNAIPNYEKGEAPWQSVAKNIYSLNIDADVTSIGNYAFYGCANLKSVSLKNITRIGVGAFEECGLESLSLPYSLSVIEKNAFHSCEELESIEFQTMSSGMNYATVEGVKTIGENAFAFCYSLQRLSFPQTLEVIGKGAFEECTALKSVSFENNGNALREIGEEAFSYCSSLYSFVIPESVTAVPMGCFRGTAFKTVKLHKNISSVGNMAFFACDKLERIDVYNLNCTFYKNEKTTPDGATLWVESKATNAISYAQKYNKPVKILCDGRSTSHPSYKKSVSKASAKAPGRIKQVCPSCGHTLIQTIAQIKTVKLTKTAFTYNAKKQYPSVSMVVITDANGKIIPTSNYTVTTQTASKAVGKHSVKIAFKSGSNYAGSFVRYYNILPKGTVIKSVDSSKKTLRVNWIKQATQTTGYQIRLCKKANFKSGVILKTIRNPKAVSFTVKSLAAKTGYYIQIRTFKTVSGTHYFSGWSKSFGRKTK